MEKIIDFGEAFIANAFKYSCEINVPSAYVSIRQHTQHTSAYVSIRQQRFMASAFKYSREIQYAAIFLVCRRDRPIKGPL